MCHVCSGVLCVADFSAVLVLGTSHCQGIRLVAIQISRQKQVVTIGGYTIKRL
jgi:hypothetical protein